MRGDEAARAQARFRALYEAHYRRVLAYVARRVSPMADAQDVVAETFTVAWRRFDDIAEGEAAATWLIGTARRILANQRRGQVRRQRLHERLRQEPPTPDADADTTAGVAGAHQLEALGRALDELSDVDREVVLLTTWERVPHAQVAEILGVATSTVAVRLHRARKRLGQTYMKELGRAGHQQGVKRDEPGDDQ